MGPAELGDGDEMRSSRLTRRQREILEYLIGEVRDKGYAPSVREIGAALGLRSPSTVHQHLTALERKGCIKRHGERMRALEVVDKSLVHKGDAVTLPVLGRISAGNPSLADQDLDDSVQVPPRLFGDVRGCFLLRVRGDSMKDAGILYGDVVVVERGPSPAPGQIVVAEIDGTTTLKFLRQGRNGTHYLEPANGRYQPIYPERELKVTAVVKGVVRKY